MSALTVILLKRLANNFAFLGELLKNFLLWVWEIFRSILAKGWAPLSVAAQGTFCWKGQSAASLLLNQARNRHFPSPSRKGWHLETVLL